MGRFSDFYLFGDSLTDQGAMHDLTSRTSIVTIPVAADGYGEAFTNGAVHAEVMTDLIGAEAVNYAVGGARAVGSVTVQQYLDARLAGQIPGLDIYQPGADPDDLAFDINFGAQMGRFLADAAAAKPEAGSAAGFLVGLNDYAEFRPTSAATAIAEATALVGQVAGGTIQAAGQAFAAGVETIVLYVMPDLRFFPLASLYPPELLALGDQMVAGHNAVLAQGALALQAAGAQVEVIDLARICDEIGADPETFGLRADLFGAPALLGTGGNPTLVQGPGGEVTAHFAANPLTAGVGLDVLGFIDFVHPTAAVHAVWGAFSARSLESETFFTGDGDDRVRGTTGADLALSGGGNDVVTTGAGSDVVLAAAGDDRVDGGAQADILSGGAGCDTLIGGCGADVLAGGAGRDVLRGGGGGDLLIAGPGRDALHGDGGADAFVFDEARMGDGPAGRMTGGAGADVLYLILEATTRAAVEAELVDGAAVQRLDTLGLVTSGIEKVVFLDPADGPAGIPTPALIDEAMLWGLL